MPKKQKIEKLSYMERYLSQLVGKKVIQLAKDASDGDMLGLVFDDSSIAWIQCDPEGNGPGFLAIEPDKSK